MGTALVLATQAPAAIASPAKPSLDNGTRFLEPGSDQQYVTWYDAALPLSAADVQAYAAGSGDAVQDEPTGFAAAHPASSLPDNTVVSVVGQGTTYLYSAGQLLPSRTEDMTTCLLNQHGQSSTATVPTQWSGAVPVGADATCTGAAPPPTPPAPDTTPPTVAAAPLSLFTTAGSVALRFSGADDHRVASYEVQWRSAHFNAGFTPWGHPSNWQEVAPEHPTVTLTGLVAGNTYCLSARARDAAGNASAWSDVRCTSVLLDDRPFTMSNGWSRVGAKTFYAGTATWTKTVGSQLTLPKAQVRRIALLVSRTPGSGPVGVYLNGTLLKRVDLRSSKVQNQQLIPIKDLGATKTGTLTVRLLGPGSLTVDGIALSRV